MQKIYDALPEMPGGRQRIAFIIADIVSPMLQRVKTSLRVRGCCHILLQVLVIAVGAGFSLSTHVKVVGTPSA